MSINDVLVTGSTGFVGKHLIPALQAGNYSIVALVREVKQPDVSDKITYFDYPTYRNRHDLQATHYIHLAGKAHDLKNSLEEPEYFEVNYELTKSIFDRFLLDDSAKTFTFISSVKAAADEVAGVLTEEDEPKPVTAYGLSKLKAEQYLLEHTPKGKTVVILRPCMIHGPGNRGNLNLLYQIVSRGIPWPLGLFHNRRSFLSVENLLYVIGEILDGNIASGVYHVADDEPLSTNELVELIAASVNRQPRIWNLSRALVQAAAKMGNRLLLPLNEERLQKLTENYPVSNEKLKRALGINKMPVSAREGMAKTLQSFQSS